MEVASFLSLVEGCNFREERKDVRIWSPNPNQEYTCKSLVSLLLDPSPHKESIFMWSEGQGFIRKPSSSFGKSCLVRLTLLIGLLGGELRLLGLFVACFVKRRRQTLIIFFGIANMHGTCGTFSCRSLVLAMLAIGAFEQAGFLLDLPFKEKGVFMACRGMSCYLGH
ncbi:ACT11D09.5 [Cucumis melo var. makuwa]|uniref:ACT11D09.5 n=1 Tax=Cucumis melo var. makuwa TaxID=1194695 RepID=A0A5A7SSD1_CUCMM|nr:ACT11D09.5 [Cucumis melo var. makuwa]